MLTSRGVGGEARGRWDVAGHLPIGGEVVGLALCPSHDARPTRAHALPLPLPGRPLLCLADGEGHNTHGETHFC